MLTLEQLLGTQTEEEATDLALAVAASLGFRVTSWQPGNPGLTLCRALGRIYADLTAAIPAVARGGFAGLAPGGWLDLVAASQFDEARSPSVFARQQVELACIAGAGPYVVLPEQLWFSDAAGRRYQNIDGGTLSSGGTFTLVAQAESPGQSYNVPPGSITTMVTPLPGVTASNVGLAQVGTDTESDASLRTRVRQKWATLTEQPPVDAYAYWTRKASPEVSDVLVRDDNALGPYTLRVLIAGVSGALSGAVVTAVADMLATKKSRTALVTVESVVNKTIPIAGTVLLRKSSITAAAAKARVEAHLDAWFRAMRIGGELAPGQSVGRVYRDAIDAQLGVALGSALVTPALTSPSLDVALAYNEKAVGNYAGITYEVNAL